MKCNLNCFDCPYPDCLAKENHVVARTTKHGRKRFNDEELRQHKREYNRLYQAKNREQIAERRKKKRDEAKKHREEC